MERNARRLFEETLMLSPTEGGRALMSTGARDVALAVLVRVERDDAFLSAALDAELSRADRLDARDRALATELAYGATRRRMRLDHALSAASDRPLTELDAGVLAALRLGAYQLLYLPRVPPRAAVHDTVEALKRSGLSRAKGFANAVLRNVARGTSPFPVDPIERLSVSESHPRWLVERWVRRLGRDEAQALCEANNRPPAVVLRANPCRIGRDSLVERLIRSGVAAEPSAVSPLGVRVSAGGAIEHLDGFAEGLFQVQDDAAQLVALLAHVEQGARVLDVCAAPGGKTGQMAAAVGERGAIVAIDLNARKLSRVAAESARLGLASRVALVAADATRPLPLFEAAFDAVVVDAPCSGLGTLRRHPELRYRRTEADIARLVALQLAILRSAAAHVKPGGHLVYAVCTPEPEEGRGVVAAFLAADSRFRLDAPAPGFPGPVEDGFLATWPHRCGCDAFFAARLRREATGSQ